MATKKTFVVTRFDPDRDEVPKTQSYEIEVQDDWKVLEALNHIKDHVDPTLSHRDVGDPRVHDHRSGLATAHPAARDDHGSPGHRGAREHRRNPGRSIADQKGQVRSAIRLDSAVDPGEGEPPRAEPRPAHRPAHPARSEANRGRGNPEGPRLLRSTS